MSDSMKRKQFHLSSADEQLPKDLADAKGTSEGWYCQGSDKELC